MLEILVVLVPFTVLAVLALRFGVDSRPVFDGRRPSKHDRPNLPPYRRT